MNRLVWVLVGLGVLTWSGLCWAVISLFQAGPRAVVAFTHWAGLEPADTQWIGDLLDIAGGLAATVVGIIWGLGLAVAVAAAWMLQSIGRNMQRSSPRRGYESDGRTVEGEVTGRRIEDDR
jgi:hypothetical protein